MQIIRTLDPQGLVKFSNLNMHARYEAGATVWKSNQDATYLALRRHVCWCLLMGHTGLSRQFGFDWLLQSSRGYFGLGCWVGKEARLADWANAGRAWSTEISDDESILIEAWEQLGNIEDPVLETFQKSWEPNETLNQVEWKRAGSRAPKQSFKAQLKIKFRLLKTIACAKTNRVAVWLSK